MPNFANSFLDFGNVLGIDVTCAVKSDKYLIDVRSDTLHKPVGFSNLGVVGCEINPCTNAVTDILRFVLITVLLTLGKNILHFGFCKAYIQRVGFLLSLAFQVLSFVIGELALVFVGKALVKFGLNLLVKCVIDSTLIGHALELHSLALGWSATLPFLGFHSGVSFIFISA